MVDHERFFSEVARKRDHPYLIKLRTPTGKQRPALNLGGGLPCPVYFPFTEATFKLRNGEEIHIPQDMMETGLQYGGSGGLPCLIPHLRELTSKVFNPPHMDKRGLIVTSGANNSIYLAVHTFLEDGDYVYMQEHTYPHIHETIKPIKVNPVSIPNDSQGLRADLLEEALSKAPAARRKMLYVIPSGDNPTTITMSESRRREVYDVACKYDILIVEDDPYFFLQYGSKQINSTFISLDTEGRVLRIDSFAKTVGAGLRTGYITADEQFTSRMQMLTSTIMAGPSSFSQVILCQLFRHWGTEGFLKFTKTVSEGYKKRRDMILEKAAKHLTGLCEWTPGDGMFLWMKVLGLEDTRHLVEYECSKEDLILVPGSACMLDDTKPSPYIRSSFSVVTPEVADMGFKVLAKIIRRELEKKKQTDTQKSGAKEAVNGLANGTKRAVNS